MKMDFISRSSLMSQSRLQALENLFYSLTFMEIAFLFPQHRMSQV
jgi:hypothetical protein